MVNKNHSVPCVCVVCIPDTCAKNTEVPLPPVDRRTAQVCECAVASVSLSVYVLVCPSARDCVLVCPSVCVVYVCVY